MLLVPNFIIIYDRLHLHEHEPMARTINVGKCTHTHARAKLPGESGVYDYFAGESDLLVNLLVIVV